MAGFFQQQAAMLAGPLIAWWMALALVLGFLLGLAAC